MSSILFPRPIAGVWLGLLLIGCHATTESPQQCFSNQGLCTGACIDLLSDVHNCGGCGVHCPAPEGGLAECVKGLCGGSCAAPAALCGARSSGGVVALSCTDTSKDPVNCGGCSNVCLAQQTCQGGTCTNCPAGQIQCPVSGGVGTTCKAFLFDNANCGGCGNTCGAGSSCQSGLCVGAGLSACSNADGTGTVLVDLQNDRHDCGTCGAACIASEICSAGECVPCGVTQCSNRCVDTTRDPYDCGSCGQVCPGTQACVSGACAAPVAVTVLPPAANGYLGSTAGVPTAQTVRVDSALAVAQVLMDVTTFASGSPVHVGRFPMNPASAFNVTPTIWSAVASVPPGPAHLDFEAHDAAWTLGALDESLHSGVAGVDVVALAPPTAANLPQLALSSAGSAIAGASAFVPLNAAPITLTATFDATSGAGIASVQFANTSSALFLGNASVALGVALLAVQPADLTTAGAGPTSLQACPVDRAGQRGPCQTNAGVGALTVGRIPVASGGAPPVLTAMQDGSAKTIVYVTSNVGVVPIDGEAVLTSASASTALPQTSPFPEAYDVASLGRAETTEGVLAVRADGSSVDRFDCSAGACNRSIYVTGTAIKRVLATTGKTVLLRDNSSALFIAFPGAAPVAAQSGGGFVTTVASGNYPFAELQDGAIVFAAQNAATAPTQASVNLAHPAVGLVTLATFTGPINDLVVSPTGEIVWQYTDAGKNWVNGTYFAGVAAPAAGTPAQILATSPYNWIRVRPQVLAGVGPDADPVRSRLRLWIGDLGKNKFFAPGAQVGDTGDIERGVRGRLGTSEYFAVSDDQLKVLYVSQDPTSSVPGGFNYTLWLTDLAAADTAAGTARLDSSPYLPVPAPNTNSPADVAPHFVHSASGTVLTADGPSATLAQVPVVVWGERLPAFGVVSFQPARMFYALYKADATPPTAVQVDRLALSSDFSTFNPANLPVPTDRFFQATSAGVALFFLGYLDQSLYSVPLASVSGTTAASTLVMDQPAAFVLREDKGRFLALRADAVLLAGQLKAGQDPAAALQPIGECLQHGPQSLDPLYSMNLFGFTPDGDHAWMLAELGGDLADVFFLPQATLRIVDLNSGARTNFGRVVFNPHNSLFAPSCQLANASWAAAFAPFAPEVQGAQQLWWSTATNAPAHTDLGLPVQMVSAFPYTQTCQTSLDGNEALVATVRSSDDSPLQVQSTPGAKPALLTPSSPAPGGASVSWNRTAFNAPSTYSPFGGPYLDEYDLLAVSQQGTSPGSMVPAGVFKVWGEVGVTGKPFPFAKVSSGFNPAPISTPPPFQTPLTRTTDGSTALLAEFTASGGIDPLGSYVIALLLAGKAPPTRPLP